MQVLAQCCKKNCHIFWGKSFIKHMKSWLRLKELFMQKEGCSTWTVRNLLNERCCIGCTLTVRVSDSMSKRYIHFKQKHFHSFTMVLGKSDWFFFIMFSLVSTERRALRFVLSAPVQRERGTLQRGGNRRWIIVSSAWFTLPAGKQASSWRPTKQQWVRSPHLTYNNCKRVTLEAMQVVCCQPFKTCL